MKGTHRRAVGCPSPVLAFVAVLLLLPLLTTLAAVAGPPDGMRGPLPDADDEPNDSFVEAIVLTQMAGQVTGSLGALDQNDFYKVLLAVDEGGMMAERLRVEVTFDTASAEPTASVTDPWGFVLDHKRGTHCVLEVTSAPYQSGYLYIQLQALRGSTSYMLEYSVNQEAFSGQDTNNDPFSAVMVGGGNPDVLPGLLQAEPAASDYQDFYRVWLEPGGPQEPAFVSLHLEVGPEAMFKVEIYDVHLTLMAEYHDLNDPSPGQSTNVSYMTHTSGDYYIRIWAANGTGVYDLTVYVLTITDLPDGDIQHASAVDFEGPNLHLASVEDQVGLNSHQGPSDPVDIWKVPVVEGQVVQATVTSTHHDAMTGLPLMKVQAFDDDGSPHAFDPGKGEDMRSFVEPEGGFRLVAPRDGNVYISVYLPGTGSGGGGYSIDIFTDSPPEVSGDGRRTAQISDEGAVVLAHVDDLFDDREGDVLNYDLVLVEVDMPDAVAEGDGLSVEVDDEGRLVAVPTPRAEGVWELTVTAVERDYGLSCDLVFEVHLDRGGNHKVLVKDPYATENRVPVPVTLVYGLHESDGSVRLSDIFRDPFGDLVEYGVTGDGVVSSLRDTAGDPPGEVLDRATVHGLVTLTPYVNPAPPDAFAPLWIGITDEARALRVEMELTVGLVAWPYDEHVDEASAEVALTIRLTAGQGSPPVWEVPKELGMDEDGELLVDLDDMIRDDDPMDAGAMEYSMSLPPGSRNLTVSKVDRSSFLLRPMRDWCGVEKGVVVVAVDTYGWEVSTYLSVRVSCVPDGPSIVGMSPPAGTIEMLDWEEVPFSVLVSDPDSGPSALVYDWYFDGYPEVAGGGPTLMFVPPPGSDGTHEIRVDVINTVTWLGTSVNWSVSIKHINLAPTAWIVVMGEDDPDGVDVTEGEDVRFVGRASDPEQADLVFRWDFGDDASANGVSVGHIYDAPGRYLVTLVVDDGEFTGMAHINITVKAQDTIVATPSSIGIDTGIIVASIILVVAFLGIGSTEPGKYRVFFLLTVLYSKIRKTEVLDHYLRGRIQGYITANPGAHYNMIKADLEINNGNLAYHLKVLERQGYIKAVRDGVYKRFYPDKMRVVRPPSLQERILVLLRNEPGLSQKDIARKLDESQSTVNDYIRRMATADLVEVQRAGVRNRCFVKVR